MIQTLQEPPTVPRYFFRLTNGDDLKDHEGDVLADDTQARRTAMDILIETLPSRTDHILADGRYVVETTDETGRLVGRLTLDSI